jgi:hypothetical protein
MIALALPFKDMTLWFPKADTSGTVSLNNSFAELPYPSTPTETSPVFAGHFLN